MMWPLGIYFVSVILVVAGMLALSYVLGERHHDPATAAPYESGRSRLRYSRNLLWVYHPSGR